MARARSRRRRITVMMRNVSSASRLVHRGTVVRAVLAAVVIAAICWYFGASVWYALVFGGALTTVGLVLTSRDTLFQRASTTWPNVPVVLRSGARNNVAELSWSLESRFGRVSHAALVSVCDVARRRLEARQLDLRDVADRAPIEALIGRRTYALLVARPRRRPRLRSLVRALDALDALEPGSDGTSPVASRSPHQVSTLRRTA